MFRSWKTSLAGLAGLLVMVTEVVNDPTALQQPDTLALISTSIAALLAKDSGVSGAGKGGMLR